MKSEDGNEAKKAVAVYHCAGGEGRLGGVKGLAEGVGSFHPFSAATGRGLRVPSTAKQVSRKCMSGLSSGQSAKIEPGRRSVVPLTVVSRLWSFGSTLKGQLTGMNRWKGDAGKAVETPDNVGGKADSADSSFGSTVSKKSKNDFKLRASQAFKSQSKENLPTSPFKQSMSHNNAAGSPMDVQRDRDLRKQGNAALGESFFPEKECIPQKGEPDEPFDMHHVRSTILRQEAEFREQVRDLHRLHKVQTLLMAEMRRKESDVMVHPSRIDSGGPSQSPVGFAVHSGQVKTPRGQGFSNTVCEYESSMVMPEFIKGGSASSQRDSHMTRPPQEANLFKQSARLPPARRTFDLERPPDEDDDEQLDCSHKPEGNCIKFIESPESCGNEPDPESDMFSLNLSTGWSRGKAVRESEQANKSEYDISRASKRPREEASLFPFLAVESERLRESPVRPTPTPASQKFLGGLWGLQLGGKLDSSAAPDRNRSPDRSEAPKKKERLSLNLEVEEKEIPAISDSNGAPHWLLKAPAAKPPRKTVCQPEMSSLNFQVSFSPPRNGTEQGLMKSSPQGRGGMVPAGMGWDSERRVSDYSPRNRSQSSNNAPEMSEDNMQARATGTHPVQMVNVGSIVNERVVYGPSGPAQGVGEASGEALNPYSSWREGGEASSSSTPHGVFHQRGPVAGGLGIQLRSFDGHPGLAAQGLVQVGHAMNMGSGSIPFVHESGSGIWLQQVNADSPYQHFQPQQQLASRQTGVVSSARHVGPWQAPMKMSQGEGCSQGAMFAVPAAAGPPVGFPLYGVQKVGEDVPRPSWTPGNVGPPFAPFSIVAPPKPPFKRPPKLVLTRDGTTMELKVVSPDREIGAKLVTEKSFSASSDEELNEKKDGGSADIALLSLRRGQDERDISMQSRGRHEREKRACNTGSVKEKDGAGTGGVPDWMAEGFSTAGHRSSQTGRTGMEDVAAALVPMAQQEGMDDADGGSSDAGSGGSGVGDVINPGEGASPPAPVGTFVISGSKRSLPAGEGEEGINMGELGLQADSESQSGRFGRKDKQTKKQEEPEEQLSASLSLRSSSSTIVRKISRGSSDGPGHVVDTAQKSVRSTEGLSDEVEKRPAAFHHVLEQSGSSSGGIMNLLVKESQCHGLGKQQNSDELRNAQREPPQPSCSTSQSRVVHASNLEDSEHQGKESSKGAESSASGLGTKVSRAHRGRVSMDIDDTQRGTIHVGQRNACFATVVDVSKQDRDIKAGHTKQLSGANTSENDVVQHKSYSPMLRQVSSPSSTVDMERHAEGSSKKVSQASETDQGNGRSPRRTTEWIGPTSMEQDHLCSPGGVDSSGEEVDGTLTSCNVSSLTWSELEEEVQRTW